MHQLADVAPMMGRRVIVRLPAPKPSVFHRVRSRLPNRGVATSLLSNHEPVAAAGEREPVGPDEGSDDDARRLNFSADPTEIVGYVCHVDTEKQLICLFNATWKWEGATCPMPTPRPSSSGSIYHHTTSLIQQDDVLNTTTSISIEVPRAPPSSPTTMTTPTVDRRRTTMSMVSKEPYAAANRPIVHITLPTGKGATVVVQLDDQECVPLWLLVPRAVMKNVASFMPKGILKRDYHHGEPIVATPTTPAVLGGPFDVQSQEELNTDSFVYPQGLLREDECRAIGVLWVSMMVKRLACHDMLHRHPGATDAVGGAVGGDAKEDDPPQAGVEDPFVLRMIGPVFTSEVNGGDISSSSDSSSSRSRSSSSRSDHGDVRIVAAKPQTKGPCLLVHTLLELAKNDASLQLPLVTDPPLPECVRADQHDRLLEGVRWYVATLGSQDAILVMSPNDTAAASGIVPNGVDPQQVAASGISYHDIDAATTSSDNSDSTTTTTQLPPPPQISYVDGDPPSIKCNRLKLLRGAITYAMNLTAHPGVHPQKRFSYHTALFEVIESYALSIVVYHLLTAFVFIISGILLAFVGFSSIGTNDFFSFYFPWHVISMIPYLICLFLAALHIILKATISNFVSLEHRRKNFMFILCLDVVIIAASIPPMVLWIRYLQLGTNLHGDSLLEVYASAAKSIHPPEGFCYYQSMMQCTGWMQSCVPPLDTILTATAAAAGGGASATVSMGANASGVVLRYYNGSIVIPMHALSDGSGGGGAGGGGTTCYNHCSPPLTYPFPSTPCGPQLRSDLATTGNSLFGVQCVVLFVMLVKYVMVWRQARHLTRTIERIRARAVAENRAMMQEMENQDAT